MHSGRRRDEVKCLFRAERLLLLLLESFAYHTLAEMAVRSFGLPVVTLAHINVTKNTMKVFMVVALVKFLDQLLASVQAANLSTE